MVRTKDGAMATVGTPIIPRVTKTDYRSALFAFRDALVFARLDRAEEASQAYAVGMKDLGPAPSDEHSRDLGDEFARWYLAEAQRREAKHLLQGKAF